MFGAGFEYGTDDRAGYFWTCGASFARQFRTFRAALQQFSVHRLMFGGEFWTSAGYGGCGGVASRSVRWDRRGTDVQLYSAGLNL